MLKAVQIPKQKSKNLTGNPKTYPKTSPKAQNHIPEKLQHRSLFRGFIAKYLICEIQRFLTSNYGVCTYAQTLTPID